MNSKILKFYSEEPNDSVEYVKAILPLIGNIIEFEIFGNNEETPYKGEEDFYYYTFILRDDKENEIWLKTLCGYSGSGPSATQEILQILGLKNNYNITNRNYIKEVNLLPAHNLNLLITRSFNEATEKEHLFWASLSFPYASNLFNAKNILKCFGINNPIRTDRIGSYGFLEDFISKNEWAKYATNSILTFYNDYNALSQTNLKTIIKVITSANSGKVHFSDIK